MSDTTPRVTRRYDGAAPRWGDKMRTLGYYDAYLGFLSSQEKHRTGDMRVVDIGAGTAAFSEAWVALNGPPKSLALVEPSRKMLEYGQAALNRRGVEPQLLEATLAEACLESSHVVLAAHVVEHCPDPLIALKQMHSLLLPGGVLQLVVSKPHWCNAIIWLQWRHRTFSENEILKLLNAAGFDPEHVYEFPSGPPSRTSRGFVASRRH